MNRQSDFRKHGSMDSNAHAGPTSFTDFARRNFPRTMTLTSNNDSIIDIETINWRIFFTRIFLIILLVLVIVCLGLYDLNPGFLFLAIFLLGFLILCLVATFVDFSCLWRWCPCCSSTDAASKTTGNSVTGGETPPPTPTATAAPVDVESPFGNYHNKL